MARRAFVTTLHMLLGPSHFRFELFCLENRIYSIGHQLPAPMFDIVMSNFADSGLLVWFFEIFGILITQVHFE